MEVSTNTATNDCKDVLAIRISDGSKVVSIYAETIDGLDLTEIRNHEDEFLADIELTVDQFVDSKSAIANVQSLCKRARDTMGEACVLEQQGKAWRSKAAEAVNLATLAKACYLIAEEIDDVNMHNNQKFDSASYKQYFIMTSMRPLLKRILWKIKYLYSLPVEQGFKVINQDLKPIADQLQVKFEKFDNDELDWGSILTSNNILIAGLLGAIVYCLIQIVLTV